MTNSEYVRPINSQSWDNMKQRCYNPNCPQYKDWGGRGIKVCDRWLHSRDNFTSDMGAKPDGDYSLDRIDNNGDYEPSNCRWATRKSQQLNQRIRVDNNTQVKGIMLKPNGSYFIQKTINNEKYYIGTAWSLNSAVNMLIDFCIEKGVEDRLEESNQEARLEEHKSSMMGSRNYTEEELELGLRCGIFNQYDIDRLSELTEAKEITK